MNFRLKSGQRLALEMLPLGLRDAARQAYGRPGVATAEGTRRLGEQRRKVREALETVAASSSRSFAAAVQAFKTGRG